MVRCGREYGAQHIGDFIATNSQLLPLLSPVIEVNGRRHLNFRPTRYRADKTYRHETAADFFFFVVVVSN